jgi:hypothetical protein
MDAAVEELLKYVRGKVARQDILDFSPSYPGHADYVRLWTEILLSGKVSVVTVFDLSEVIGLRGWGDPEKERDPARFRHYRRFTSAVALVLIHEGNSSEAVRPLNYLLRDLICDVDSSSPRHLALVRSAIASTRELLRNANEELEYPCLIFALLILAQKAGDWDAAEQAATECLRYEEAVRKNEAFSWYARDHRFLHYHQLIDDWHSIARQLQNPRKHDDTQIVIDAFLPDLRSS